MGITIVLITHQMNVVQQIANRVAVISSGKVVESGSVYDVFAAPRQPVTKRFISTAISGIPEESRINTMHEENLGHIVTVLIRQHDVEEREDGTVIAASGQNISQLIAKHGVRSSSCTAVSTLSTAWPSERSPTNSAETMSNRS